MLINLSKYVLIGFNYSSITKKKFIIFKFLFIFIPFKLNFFYFKNFGFNVFFFFEFDIQYLIRDIINTPIYFLTRYHSCYDSAGIELKSNLFHNNINWNFLNKKKRNFLNKKKLSYVLSIIFFRYSFLNYIILNFFFISRLNNLNFSLSLKNKNYKFLKKFTKDDFLNKPLNPEILTLNIINQLVFKNFNKLIISNNFFYNFFFIKGSFLWFKYFFIRTNLYSSLSNKIFFYFDQIKNKHIFNLTFKSKFKNFFISHLKNYMYNVYIFKVVSLIPKSKSISIDCSLLYIFFFLAHNASLTVRKKNEKLITKKYKFKNISTRFDRFFLSGIKFSNFFSLLRSAFTKRIYPNNFYTKNSFFKYNIFFNKYFFYSFFTKTLSVKSLIVAFYSISLFSSYVRKWNYPLNEKKKVIT